MSIFIICVGISIRIFLGILVALEEKAKKERERPVR